MPSFIAALCASFVLGAAIVFYFAQKVEKKYTAHIHQQLSNLEREYIRGLKQADQERRRAVEVANALTRELQKYRANEKL